MACGLSMIRDRVSGLLCVILPEEIVHRAGDNPHATGAAGVLVGIRQELHSCGHRAAFVLCLISAQLY